MPLDEEGAKWSCEPCIRGHRSSKCEHFDRLMIKVPKAGRPLAKCPHPKGTCSCQKTYALMVRIPKGSGCVCRPLYKLPAGSSDSDASNPPSGSTVATPSPGRVQKIGRRQSHIQTAPENLARALDSMPDNLKEEDGISSSYMARLPSHHTVQNGDGSCCSPTPATTTPSTSAGLPSTPAGTWNPVMQVEPGTSWVNPVAPASSTYTPFGVNSPTQQVYMNNYNTTPSMPPTPFSGLANGLGISDPALNPYTAAQETAFDAASLFNGEGCGTECQCGDDCQCLGCAAHPFNNTTRERVQEMGVLMIDRQETTPNGWSQTYPGGYFTPANNGVPQHAYQPTPYTDQPYGSPHPPVVNGFSQPLAPDAQPGDGLMHPAEYHTLEYPVGISCSDVTGSCQCGSDCSCIGCLTHTGHNGFPAKTPFEQLNDHVTKEEQQPSSCCGPPSTRDNLPVTSMM